MSLERHETRLEQVHDLKFYISLKDRVDPLLVGEARFVLALEDVLSGVLYGVSKYENIVALRDTANHAVSREDQMKLLEQNVRQMVNKFRQECKCR